MKTFLFAFIGLVALAGCTPKQKAGDESRPDRVPVGLTITPDHRRLTLTWTTQGDANFTGYNIYVVPAEELSEDASRFNEAPFPGDTTPDDKLETFEATGLENGVEYKIWVRVQHADGTQSRSTDTVTAVCGGRGTLTLGVRLNAENDGFSFADNQIVRANAPTNDLYFHMLQGVAYLASPTRLDGFLRSSTFFLLPYEGDFASVSAKVMAARPWATEARVAVVEGDWVLLRTADNTHTLLQVTTITGTSDDDATIRLAYAYCPLTHKLYF